MFNAPSSFSVFACTLLFVVDGIVAGFFSSRELDLILGMEQKMVAIIEEFVAQTNIRMEAVER